MRILVSGDTHGGSETIWRKAKIAKDLGCDRILVVGDFGLWGGYGGVEFLDHCNFAASEFGLHIFALPGNHENHDQWNQWLQMDLPTSSGFTYVRSRVLISPKVHNWKWSGKRFFIAGGAVSVDKAWRKPGVSWWEDEEFTQSDLESVERYKGPDIDYLFTHDCSDHTPFRGRLKPDPESQANRQRIDRTIRALKPRYHFHGHMHTRYEWHNDMSHGMRYFGGEYDESNWNGCTTRTYGLECDNENNSWVVLELPQEEPVLDDDGKKTGEMHLMVPEGVYWPDEAKVAFAS